MNNLNYDGLKHPFLDEYLKSLFPDLQLYLRDGFWVTNAADVTQLEKLIADFDPLPAAKLDALEKIDNWHSATLNVQVAGYSQTEIDTWPVKLTVAKAYLAGTATQAEIAGLEFEAPIHNRTTQSHAERIVERAGAYFYVISELAYQRDYAKNAVNQATKLSQVEHVLTQLN